MPEVASRHHLELANAVVDDALRAAGVTLDDVDARRGDARGPGLVGALLVGVSTAKGIAAARGLPLAPVDHLQGHVAANFLAGPSRSSRRSCASSPAAATRSSPASRTAPSASPCSARRSTTRPARRSTRARGCSACRSPAGPHLERLAARGRPAGLRLPDRRTASPASTSPSPGLKTALLYKVRDLGGGRRARAARPTSPPPTSTRSSRRSRAAASARSSRPASSALAIGGGVAANGPLRERLAGLGRRAQGPAARAVHRQRGDDRRRRALRARRWPFPEHLALDAYADGQRGL